MNAEYAEEKAKELRADYESRAAQRSAEEARWRLNARMVEGDQFSVLTADGAIAAEEKSRYWEERTAFNHLAAILETRLARLARVRPKLSVRPSGSDESDVTSAKVSAKILECACHNLNIGDILGEATMWSELTGTVFYKLSWDADAGMTVGKSGGGAIKEGDVRVDVCPPYEIFPDSVYSRSVRECNSIIHAKSVHVADIKRIWGADVEEEEDAVVDYSRGGMFPSAGETRLRGHALVIERYTRPDREHPMGRYEAAAGNKLLAEGDLPFLIGENGEPDLPFVRQRSLPRAGRFYGVCPVERAIPVQRAYNAVKNRKHEFMNRIAAGVLAVEDGSVDLEELQEDGLAPGKILVYRAGSSVPAFLDPGSIPEDFDREERKLLEEFAAVSGVSEFMSASSVPSNISSGSALELLIEQDDSRLTVSADEIRSCLKEIGRMMLRLYRQYAASTRLSRFVGDSGDVEMIAWNAASLSGEDIIVDTENQLGDTIASRRNTVLKLYEAGLLGGADGKADQSVRYGILQAFGFAGLEHADNVAELQRLSAKRENAAMAEGQSAQVKIYDDHSAHIDVHTAFALSGNADGRTMRAVEEHIARYKEENEKNSAG